MADRLDELQTELASLLEGQLEALGGAAKRAESMAWRIGSAAGEAERNGAGSAAKRTSDLQRVDAIRAELFGLMESRSAELADKLGKLESASRKILHSELELERHRGAADELGVQSAHVQDELAEIRRKVEGARTTLTDAQEERDELRDELAKALDSVRETQRQTEALRAEVARAQQESASLDREVETLRVKHRALEDNVARMRKLREELMHSMTGLTQESVNVVSGGGTGRGGNE